jgi:phosphoribosylanthranilate isomerase
MIVQIYETQDAAEARALEAVGVDHIGVLVGQGRYARELRPLQARLRSTVQHHGRTMKPFI